MNKENTRPKLNQKHRPSLKSEKEAPRCVQQNKSQSKDEQYKAYMKYLIATNSDYFQNKMKVSQAGKPKEIKFKMPSKTGMTIYKRDYYKKQAKYQEDKVKHNMSVDCIKTNNFLKDQKINLKIGESTMYQSQFKYLPIRSQNHKRVKRRVETQEKEEDNAPRFFQTQNKLDFLNWAGKNYVPSMKPEQKAAITNAAFGATSVYKTDFEGKKAAQTPIFIREPSIVKFGCSTPLMKTSYKDDYSLKKSQADQIDCKPRYFEATLCKKFKGSTEYKRQYIKGKKDQDHEEAGITLQELQTIIIDL